MDLKEPIGGHSERNESTDEKSQQVGGYQQHQAQKGKRLSQCTTSPLSSMCA